MRIDLLILVLVALSCTGTSTKPTTPALTGLTGDTGPACDARTHPLAQVCRDNGLDPRPDPHPLTTASFPPCDFPMPPCRADDPDLFCLLPGDAHCQMVCFNEEADADADTDIDEPCGSGY